MATIFVPSRPSTGRGAPTGRRGRPRVVAVVALVVSGLSLVPLGYVVVATAATGWNDSMSLVLRPRVGELLLNTVLLVVVSVPLCVALGVGAAWLVDRTALWGHRGWALALAAPLAIPAFVNSYGWVSAVSSLAGLWSGVLISVLSYFPLVFIPVAAALSRLDPILEESAAALGDGPVRRFFRVVLPQLRLAVTGGALLVGLHLLAEYGAFAMIRFDTFTTAIMVQYQSTFNGAAGTMLASVLVGLCLVMLVIEVRARGIARYARVGSGAPVPPTRAPLGSLQIPAQLALIALVGLAIGVPLSSVLRWAARGGTEIWSSSELAPALIRTMGYGLAGALVTTLLAFPVALLVVRWPGRLARTLELCNYVTSSLPGIVVGLALVTVSIRLVPGLYQTDIVLVAAYAMLFLPRALVNLRSGLAQAPPELEQAAQSLGRTPTGAFTGVTLRLLAPAAAAGGALVFLGVVNELTATLLLGPTGTRTLATEFWSLASEIDYMSAAPYALLMVGLSAPMTYVLFRQSRKAVGG
jgi:iron(III) transport system permease protein